MACPVITNLLNATVSTLSVDDLAGLLQQVDLPTLQQALVKSGTIGVDTNHLKLAIEHDLISVDSVLDIAYETADEQVRQWAIGMEFETTISEDDVKDWIAQNYTDTDVFDLIEDQKGSVMDWLQYNL